MRPMRFMFRADASGRFQNRRCPPISSGRQATRKNQLARNTPQLWIVVVVKLNSLCNNDHGQNQQQQRRQRQPCNDVLRQTVDIDTVNNSAVQLLSKPISCGICFAWFAMHRLVIRAHELICTFPFCTFIVVSRAQLTAIVQASPAHDALMAYVAVTTQLCRTQMLAAYRWPMRLQTHV